MVGINRGHQSISWSGLTVDASQYRGRNQPWTPVQSTCAPKLSHAALRPACKLVPVPKPPIYRLSLFPSDSVFLARIAFSSLAFAARLRSRSVLDSVASAWADVSSVSRIPVHSTRARLLVSSLGYLSPFELVRHGASFVLSKTRRKDVGRSQEEGLGTVRGHAGWLGGEDHLLGRVPTLPWR